MNRIKEKVVAMMSQDQDKLEPLQASINTLADLHVQTSIALERVKTELAHCRGIAPRFARSQPTVDTSRFCIVWNGGTCRLGPTNLYRLIERLIRRPNHLFSYAQLLQDVWSDHQRSDDTIRSTICQLRTRLRRSGMKRLARCIRIGPPSARQAACGRS